MVGPLQKTVVVVSKHTNRGEEQKLISPGVVVGWGWGGRGGQCVSVPGRGKQQRMGCALKGWPAMPGKFRTHPFERKRGGTGPAPLPGGNL